MSDRRTLSVVFRAVDEMSSRIGQMANAGRQAAQQTEQFGRSANQAFSNATQASERMAQSASRAGEELGRYGSTSEHAARAGQQMEESSRRAAQEIDGQTQAQQEASDAARRMAQESERTSTAVNDSERAAQQAADAVDNLGNQSEQTGEQARRMGEDEQRAGNSTDEMRQQMERARDEHGRFRRQTDETRQSTEENRRETERETDAMQELGQILVSAGIVAGLKKIAEAARECAAEAETVETAFAKLQTISGESMIGSLSEQVMELSSSSGIAAESLADVAYNAISAGTATEDSVNMAGTAARLAAAGFTDTSSALSTLETALNSYGDAAGSAEDISNSLIMVQNLGVTTVAELSRQMGKAIATASAYDVSLGNLESAYISTTKSGIATAESTTYISSMLNELGKNGTTVSNTLKDKTGKSFGELMASGSTLADVLGILHESVNGNAEAMMNLWGSAEAGKAAAAIVNQGLETFNDNLKTVENSAGATATAYKVMANTTEHSHNKMQNAALNMKVAIGNQLNPVLSGLYEKMAGIYTAMGDFVNEHPKVIAVVTGATIAVGTLAAGVAAYTLATKASTLATKAAELAQKMFNATMSANPVFLVITGIVALTAAVSAYAAMTSDAIDPLERLTTESQKMADSISETEKAYRQACVSFGDTSNEAMSLKSKLKLMEEEFESSKQTVGDFYDELDSMIENHDKVVASYDDQNKAIREEKFQTASLITELKRLNIETGGSISTNEKAKAIIAKLNEEYPELGTNIGEVSANLDRLEKRLNKVREAQSKQKLYDNATTTYTELVEEQAQLEDAKEEAYAIFRRASDAIADQSVLEHIGTFTKDVFGSGLSEEYDDAKEKYEEATRALEENRQKQEECSETMKQYADILNGTSEEAVSAYDASNIAIEQYKESMQKLVEEYYTVYSAAQESIQGQYNLWDKVENEATTSMDEMNAALDSQIAYWESYSQNLMNLQSRNIEGLREMVDSMDDGSEESAAALQAMAGASDEQLQEMVRKFEELKGKQDETASNMAENATGFNGSLDDMSEKMRETVANMKMEDDAEQAAKATMNAYVNRIRSYAKSASDAATTVATAAVNALNTNALPANAPQSLVKGHAKGTRYSEPVYIAGEEGPELIVSGSGGGDTVYTADQTRRIADALLGGKEEETKGPEMIVSESGGDTVYTEDKTRRIADALIGGKEEATIGEKRTENPIVAIPTKEITAERRETEDTKNRNITIELKGSGSIKTDRNENPETIWDGIKNNLKQTIISMLQEEIYEEASCIIKNVKGVDERKYL